MSLTTLNIPKKMCVGYQKRNDTYTGKLAYVTYYDLKGKLRKELSWNNWRDKEIKHDEYDNVPTEGFVLNKKVGGHSWGWNPRRTMVRVYDPREFEFEITVANLLFILEECSSIKGKGLEGSFVYALDGKDLILLPVTSQEYVQSTNYTNLQTMKVTKKDMVEGCWYQSKDNKEVMYLGRENYYTLGYDFTDYGSWTGWKRQIKSNKLHIFIDQKGKYWTQKGFTKLAIKSTTEPDPKYADKYDVFKKSVYGSACSKIVFLPIEETDSLYNITYLETDRQWYGYRKRWYTDDTYEVYNVSFVDGIINTVQVKEKQPKPKGQEYSPYLENEYGEKIAI